MLLVAYVRSFRRPGQVAFLDGVNLCHKNEHIVNASNYNDKIIFISVFDCPYEWVAQRLASEGVSPAAVIYGSTLSIR
jgi:hypothetical protein